MATTTERPAGEPNRVRGSQQKMDNLIDKCPPAGMVLGFVLCSVSTATDKTATTIIRRHANQKRLNVANARTRVISRSRVDSCVNDRAEGCAVPRPIMSRHARDPGASKRCFRQKLYDFEGDIRWYHRFDLKELFEGHIKVTFNFL
ncbi:hypothetical protein EAG_01288 [Camponotus floridanus]|uniref:Uncharacterized protein n=1 Tax=Camponotus floridanus TaxID=104421 RepID=E2AER5_CAMFO|nr:hypothetical protein EAG_01288 [Camponotus floridanus]